MNTLLITTYEVLKTHCEEEMKADYVSKDLKFYIEGKKDTYEKVIQDLMKPTELEKRMLELFVGLFEETYKHVDEDNNDNYHDYLEAIKIANKFGMNFKVNQDIEEYYESKK